MARYTASMTIALAACAALLLGHLWRSRTLREQRWHAARERRRDERERQWRAMIDDAATRHDGRWTRD